jgi:hypothetical protein
MGLRTNVALAAGLTLLGAMASPAARAETAWTPYSNAAFRFSLDIPAPPEVTTSTEKTEAGPMPTLQGTITLDAANALQITALDVSQLSPDPGADALLEGGAKGALKATDSTLDEEKTIAVNGAVGRVIVFHNATVKFKTQLLYFNKSVIGITGVGVLGADITPAFDRMTASLRFLP